MKKKLWMIAMSFCLICTMLLSGTAAASAYGGEPGDAAPTVTMVDKRGSEFYTLEYDTYQGWTFDVYTGSDTIVYEVTIDGNVVYDDCIDEHVNITNVPDGAAIAVSFAGKYPASDSPRLDSKLIKLSYTKATYNGKAKKPQIKIGTKKQADLVKQGLITVKYVNNTKPGIAKVIVKAGPKAHGKFEGETTLYFRIAPKKMMLSSAVSEKKGELVLKWKTQKLASGYQLLISEAEDFDAAKTFRFTLGTGKDTSLAFKEAKSGTKYYVKVRSFRDTKSGRSYGAWSKAMNVTAK